MYRRRRSRKINARTLFAALLVIVFLAVWLPASWTRPLNHVVQLLAPVQDALSGIGASASDALESGSAPAVSADELARAQRENQALTNRLTALTARVSELESQNRDLSRLRQLGFSNQGVLIPAHVIRRDAVSWRDSVMLDRGARSDSRRDDWVVSRRFVDVGGESGVSTGMAVLAGEVLVGRVQSTSPYTSLVVLLSDPTQKTPVRFARREGDRLDVLPAEFLLQGRGRGRMQVADVAHDYVDAGRIRRGDLVVCDPVGAGLPATLVIGHVSGIEPTKESPFLLYRLDVEPVVEPDELRRVYIVNMSPASPR